MAIVMKMHWTGLKKEHYEAVRRETNFEGDAPRGGKYHVAWLTSDGLHVLDVWESAKQFEDFVQTRLMPAAQKHGLPGEPKVEIFEAHNTFAPSP
jgi:hypothetical protein